MKVKTQEAFDEAVQKYDETIDPLVQKLAEVCKAQGCGIVLFTVPAELVGEEQTITALRGAAHVLGVDKGGSEFLHMVNEVASDPDDLRQYLMARHLKSAVDALCGILKDAAPKQYSPEFTPFPPGHA